MKKGSLILIGGGGHCKACIDVIEREGVYSIKGILDSREKKGEMVLGYSVVGSDNDIPSFVKKGYYFLITIGQIKNADTRKRIYNQLKSLSANLATIISPKANISKYARISEGSIVMHGVNVNADVSIGVNCILNTSSNIEHDVVVGNHCHVSTSSVVNGNCTLGDEIFVGSGVVISNGVSLCDQTIVGAGSLVVKNITESGTFVGNPLRKL